MTIYILGTPEETAQALDDKSLDKMIRDIAQVLCNVHLLWYRENYSNLTDEYWNKYTKETYLITKPFFHSREINDKWSQWARECRANYLYLVELLNKCVEEIWYRDSSPTRRRMKEQDILIWAAFNVPDLPFSECPLDLNPSPFPLVIPNKYITADDWMIPPQNVHYSILSYRNYYQAKLTRLLKQCENEYCDGCYLPTARLGYQIKWTNRKKPNWLSL